MFNHSQADNNGAVSHFLPLKKLVIGAIMNCASKPIGADSGRS